MGRTLYIYEQNVNLRLRNERIVAAKEGLQLYSEPIINVSSIIIMDTTQITGKLMTSLMESGITVVYAKKIGRIIGMVTPVVKNDVFLRIAQYDAWKDKELRLCIAKNIVAEKIESQKTIALKYKSRDYSLCTEIIRQLDDYLLRLTDANDVYSVMGIEGAATNCYYGLLRRHFVAMPFVKRTRHPPRDEVNSLLSLTYMMVLNQIQTHLIAEGFDTSIGYLHSIKANRESLGLDMLEAYRAGVDNVVMNWVNRLEFVPEDFICDDNGGYFLHKDAFKRYISKYTQNIMLEDDICKRVSRLRNVIKRVVDSETWQPE